MTTLAADQIKILLAETLSPYAEIRRSAEDRLVLAQKDSSHHLEILKIIASTDGSDDTLRQSAAVHFKNTVKKGWDVNREDGNDGIIITESDRTTIKTHLVQLMCTVPPKVQILLSESISLIAEVDFPDKWTNLLPELVQQFNSSDITTVIGVLKTASSICNSFRYVERSDALYRVIKYTLEIIQGPLLGLFLNIGKAVQTFTSDIRELIPRFESLCIICDIYYSLNYQDLPEFFEDHMTEWMSDFASYLEYQNAILVDNLEEQNPGPVDNLQVSIIEILSLYASKDEEAFIEFLPKFTTLVWNLLTNLTIYPKHDSLATKSIKFLSNLIEKPMHKHLFQDSATLRQIVAKVVIPNLTFRESDEERFEDDPREYILTEVEGSDSETRRRSSEVLLRAMCRLFEEEAVIICSEHIATMLSDYMNNPTNSWISKDAAIQLLMGIAIKKESALGVSEITQGVDILEFFKTQILQELQDANHASRPVLKATALKFVSVFRNQFNRESLIQLFPLLITHLTSPVVVVHTFAAFTIERILFTKDDVADGPSVFKITSSELLPFVEPLFTSLFSIVDNQDHNENDYVMKCVMRSLIRAQEDILPVTEIVLVKLTSALGRVAANPRNPQFNHYLFESIAVLVKSVCSANANGGESLESMLFEPFTVILQLDIDEFTPYVFQVLAQLLEYRPSGNALSPAYTGLFQPLLTPALWEKKGNVPALTRLLQAYICKAATELVPHLAPILGVFQKLISVRATETSAFEILNAVTIHFPFVSVEPMLQTIFAILFTRLQTGKTPRYTQLVTTFFALFVGKYGAQLFFDKTNLIQAGIGTMIVVHVWVPRLKNDPPVQHVEAKVHVVGVTKLLCDFPLLLNDANGQKSWIDSLAGIVALLTSPKYKDSVATKATEEVDIEVGYDAQYSRLVHASKQTEDPFPDINDPNAFFAQSLHGNLTNNSTLLTPILQHALSDDPKLKAGLESVFHLAGLSL